MINWLRKGVDDARERMRQLVERTKAGLSTRANDAVVREAIANRELVYLQVRKSDKLVLCNENNRPTYYSQDFVDKYPRAAADTMMWVSVDPKNPLMDVDLKDDGGWYYAQD